MQNRNSSSQATLTNSQNSDAISTQPSNSGDVTLVQCEVTSGTPSWMVQGRLSSGLTWVDLLDAAQSGSGIVSVVTCRQIRIVQTGTAVADYHLQ